MITEVSAKAPYFVHTVDPSVTLDTHLWEWTRWWFFLPRYVQEEQLSAPHTSSKISLLLPSRYCFLRWIPVKREMSTNLITDTYKQGFINYSELKKNVIDFNAREIKIKDRSNCGNQTMPTGSHRDCSRGGYRFPLSYLMVLLCSDLETD